MTEERFYQLWNALVEDAPKDDKEDVDRFLPSNGISSHLKKALLKSAEDENSCLAMNVPIIKLS